MQQSYFLLCKLFIPLTPITTIQNFIKIVLPFLTNSKWFIAGSTKLCFFVLAPI